MYDHNVQVGSQYKTVADFPFMKETSPKTKWTQGLIAFIRVSYKIKTQVPTTPSSNFTEIQRQNLDQTPTL